MAFKNFSKDLFNLVYDGNEKIKIAEHTIVTGGELGSLRVLMYLKGSPSGSVKLYIYPKGVTNAAICSSNTVSFSSVGSDFLGFVRLDFQKNNIQSGQQIDIYAEASGYTRNGNTDYFSLIFDFPSPVYDNLGSTFSDHPIAIEDFVYL